MTNLQRPCAGDRSLDPGHALRRDGRRLGSSSRSTPAATWAAANVGLSSPIVNGLWRSILRPPRRSTPAPTMAGSSSPRTQEATGPPPDAEPRDLRVQALAIDPATPATLYAGTASGVSKSTDSGADWAGANSGLTRLNVSRSGDRSRDSHDTLRGDLLRRDLQVDRLRRHLGRGQHRTNEPGGADALAIDPADAGEALRRDEAAAGLQVHRLRRHLGRGQRRGCGGLSGDVLAIDPATPSTLYVGTLIEVSGSPSTPAASGSKPVRACRMLGPVVALAIDPATPATLYAGTSWRRGLQVGPTRAGIWAEVDDGPDGLARRRSGDRSLDPGRALRRDGRRRLQVASTPAAAGPRPALAGGPTRRFCAGDRSRGARDSPRRDSRRAGGLHTPPTPAMAGRQLNERLVQSGLG